MSCSSLPLSSFLLFLFFSTKTSFSAGSSCPYDCQHPEGSRPATTPTKGGGKERERERGRERGRHDGWKEVGR